MGILPCRPRPAPHLAPRLSFCQTSRSGAPASSQARISRIDQTTREPNLIGGGSFPAASQVRTERTPTPNSRAKSFASATSALTRDRRRRLRVGNGLHCEMGIVSGATTHRLPLATAPGIPGALAPLPTFFALACNSRSPENTQGLVFSLPFLEQLFERSR